MEVTEKRNCICLSCKNLDYEFFKEGILKCVFQFDTDEIIDGALLRGETDKCPFDFYEKEPDSTIVFSVRPIRPFYAGGKVPERVISYDCPGCTHYVNRSCPAFPEGIPCNLINVHGHKEKLPGQNTDIVCDWDEEKYDNWACQDPDDDFDSF